MAKETITRVERGVTGDVAWHVRREDGSRYWLLWYGPGSRLRLALSPRGSLVTIDHPSASDDYRSFKDANAAARRFVAAAEPSSDRDRSRAKISSKSAARDRRDRRYRALVHYTEGENERIWWSVWAPSESEARRQIRSELPDGARLLALEEDTRARDARSRRLGTARARDTSVRSPIRHEDGTPDRRYTFTREHTGSPHGRSSWVARFTGNWIGAHPSKDVAIELAQKHQRSRGMGAARDLNRPRPPRGVSRRDAIDRREASEERAWRAAHWRDRRFSGGEREILYRGRWENLASLAESQLRAFEAEQDKLRDPGRGRDTSRRNADLIAWYQRHGDKSMPRGFRAEKIQWMRRTNRSNALDMVRKQGYRG